MQRYILIITGSTAVGKTELALSCAAICNGEIINGDVGQMYVPCTIGTAKPDWRSLPIAHHLFDSIAQPRNMTVIEYRKQVSRLIDEIWSRNAIPIIVGGSTLYIASLFFPPHDLESVSEGHSLSIADDQLWSHLDTIDPERAAKLHPHDTYRLRRALDIWYTSGRKPSQYTPLYQPIAPYHCIVVARDTADLYERITRRTKSMLDNGWIDEVQRLCTTDWESFLKQKKLIGYDDIIDWLQYNRTHETKRTVTDLAETIAIKTRQYAKRQNTFWRMLIRKLAQIDDFTDTIATCHSFNVTEESLDNILQKIEKIIQEKE
jgi:tRNA dimethylallyltransferase